MRNKEEDSQLAGAILVAGVLVTITLAGLVTLWLIPATVGLTIYIAVLAAHGRL